VAAPQADQGEQQQQQQQHQQPQQQQKKKKKRNRNRSRKRPNARKDDGVAAVDGDAKGGAFAFSTGGDEEVTLCQLMNICDRMPNPTEEQPIRYRIHFSAQ